MSTDDACAAGLLPYLPNPGLGLIDLAWVVISGGRLVLFQSSGRGMSWPPAPPVDLLTPICSAGC